MSDEIRLKFVNAPVTRLKAVSTALKLKTLPLYPALLVGASGINISIVNGVATFSIVPGTFGVGSLTPQVDAGGGSPGFATTASREDHIHPTDTSRAPLVSPAFAGTPTAPTPTAGDNSTRIATTEFVLANAAPTSVSPTRVVLKAVDTTRINYSILTESGRLGPFAFLLGNFTAQIAADTNEGCFIKANGVPASVGAWVRIFDFVNYWARWFGAVADHATDNTAIINTMITVANLPNTLTTPGKQAAAYLNIEGGVRFSMTLLNFLSAGNFVFVYLRYFANSDLTKGVNNFGGGTNELMEMSVNSGFPGDASGDLVGERRFEAPLHPAIILNVRKEVAGADAHLGTGQVRAPTSTSPARASFNLFDENVIRWRAVYEGYGNNNVATQVSLQPFTENVSMANVGTIGWPTSPATGTVITGVISGARGYKKATQGNPTLALDVTWISGTYIPGERVTDGVTTSTNSITGGGVTVTTDTFPMLSFGINSPAVAYGEFAGNAITGFAIHGRLTIGQTNAAVSTQRMETVTDPAILFTRTNNAKPVSGKQIVFNAGGELVLTNGVAQGGAPIGKIGLPTVCGFFTNGGAVQNVFNLATAVRTGVGTYTINFTNGLASSGYVPFAQPADQRDKPVVTVSNTGNLVIQNFDHATLGAADLRGVCYLTIFGGNG